MITPESPPIADKYKRTPISPTEVGQRKRQQADRPMGNRDWTALDLL